MKTRKTLKKRRTSKKYNKTKFRRFNKYNNLTSKMKGGGGFLDMFKPSLPKYYSDWIDKLEQLKTKLTGDTTYPWLLPETMRQDDLKSIETALTQFRKKEDIEATFKELFDYLIEKYSEKEADSRINTENRQQISQQIANAKNLLSILFEDRIQSKNWLEKYIAHLSSDNSGLTEAEKKRVEIELQQINDKDVMNSDEQVKHQWEKIEPQRDLQIKKRQQALGIARLAEHEVEDKAEHEAEQEEQEEQEAVEQSKPENSSRSSTVFDTFTSRFRGSTVPKPPVVEEKMQRNVAAKLGAISRPTAVPALKLPGYATAMEAGQGKFNNYIRKNGGINKRTFKRKVKSKKRRR